MRGMIVLEDEVRDLSDLAEFCRDSAHNDMFWGIFTEVTAPADNDECGDMIDQIEGSQDVQAVTESGVLHEDDGFFTGEEGACGHT